MSVYTGVGWAIVEVEDIRKTGASKKYYRKVASVNEN